MRSSRVVRASDGQRRSRNCPGFDPSILRLSGIWGWQMKQCWIFYIKKKNPNIRLKKEFEKFLREEGVEGVICLSDAGIAGHLAVRLNAVLQAVELPAGIPHLHACLTNVDWDALPHFLGQRKYNSPEAKPKISASYLLPDKGICAAFVLIDATFPSPGLFLLRGTGILPIGPYLSLDTTPLKLSYCKNYNTDPSP